MELRNLNKHSLLFAFVFLACEVSSYADTTSDLKACIEIKNPTKRVACFDLLANNLLSIEIEKERQSKKDAELELKRKDEEKVKLDLIEKEKFIAAAKDPLRSLRKLQSRVQTGISYREYPTAVSDVKFEIGAYSREFSRKTPEYSTHLNNALTKYSDAITAWNYKFEGNRVEPLIWSLGVVSFYKQKYPELSAAETTGGLRIDSVLQILWGLASRDIELAEQELAVIIKNR